MIVDTKGTREEIPAEGVFLLTGYHPDADLMRRARIECHPETLIPTLDPETFETNVPNLFLAGGASNWVDRLVHGRVVDFLNLGIGPLRTGVFNVADVAIMAGLGLLLWAQLIQDRPQAE